MLGSLLNEEVGHKILTVRQMHNVVQVALDCSIAYTSGLLGVDGGIKGRVPALTFDLYDRDFVSQSNTCMLKSYKTPKKQQ